MALQTSGPISMSEIIEETFGSPNGTSTLTTCGSLAGFSSPISMSDFYGLGGSSITTVNLRYHVNNTAVACNFGAASDYYSNGGSTPDIGDTLYSNAAGTNTVPAGYYSNEDKYWRVISSSSGVIALDGDCT